MKWLKEQMSRSQMAIVGLCEGQLLEIRLGWVLEGKDTTLNEKMDCRACENKKELVFLFKEKASSS